MENMQTLFLKEELFELLDCGKNVTIRKGYKEIKLGELKLLSPVEGDEHSMKRIVDVTHVLYSKANDIPIGLVNDDGFFNHDDMIEKMKEFYPDFNENTECTVLLFETA